MALTSTTKRPAYHFPVYGFLHLSSSLFFNWPRRTFAIDARYLLDSHTPRPILTGIENLPTSGPCLLVANHYQRNGLWIGWVGSMLVDVLNTIRPAQFPLRIVVTDAQRYEFRGKTRVVPFSGWFINRIATLWGMIPISGNSEDTAAHASSLRKVLTMLRRGEPLLFFPEGDQGSADKMLEALPSTGTFIALAARYAPIIPVAFWEEGENFEQLRGHIGQPLTIHYPADQKEDADQLIRQQIMNAIKTMIPQSRRPE